MNYSLSVKFLKNNTIWAVLFGASLVRFWGIWHGYPFSYYPDEEHFINLSLSFGSGDLNPHWFHKPAFLMYLLFFEYGLFFVAGKIFGYFPTSDAFAVYYFQSPWAFVLIGRITITLFGIGTIYFIYRIGKEFWSEKVGLLGAVFLSLCFGHIFSGQDVKADIPATFFTVLSVYFILRTVNKGFQTKNYILAGLFAGLGTATKYYSIALLPCLFAVTLLEIFQYKNLVLLKKYIYALFAYWGIYFLTSPYNFLDPLGRESTFGLIVKFFNRLSPIKIELFSSLDGFENPAFNDFQGHYILRSVINYFDVLVSRDGVGMVLGIVFILSFIYVVFKPTVKGIIFILFPFIFSLISNVWNPSYTEPRHQLIIYPFLSLCAGILFCDLFEKTRRFVFTITTLLIIATPPLIAIVQNNLLVSRIDTRTLSKQWIEKNITPRAKVLLDEYSPVLNMNRENIEKFIVKAERVEKSQFTTHLETFYKYKLKALTGITYELKPIRHVWWRYQELQKGESIADTEYDKDMANPIKEIGISDYADYKESGFQYLVTSNLAYGSYLDPKSSRGERFPSYRKFYEDVFSRGIVVKEFDPTELNLPGPLIKVIKIN